MQEQIEQHARAQHNDAASGAAQEAGAREAADMHRATSSAAGAAGAVGATCEPNAEANTASANTAAGMPSASGNRKKTKKTDPTRLGRESVGKLLLEFSVPATFMMLFNTLYNIIDTAFLQTSLGDAGAAVATLAFPVMTLLMGFSALAGVGGNALSAIQLGEGKHDAVERTLGNTFVLLICLGVLSALAALFFMDTILDLISTPAELRDWTGTFLFIICGGYTLQSLGLGMNNFLRTAGKPNLAMLTQGLGTVVCIVLNYLFVLCWGWGVAGSAAATILGQGAGMLPTVGYFLFVKSAPFRLHLRCCKPRPRLMGRILVMGLASFIMQVGNMFVSLVFNMVVAKYAAIDGVSPDTALAALGIALKSLMLCFTFMCGVMMGSQPIFGFNFGAKKWDRVLRCFKLSCIAAAVLGLVYTVLTFLIPDAIVSIFGVKGEAEELAARSLQISAIWLGPVGFQIIGSSYFQSSGQPLKSAVLEMTRQILFLIPMYLFLPPVFMALFGVSGLNGVIMCKPLSDITSVCVTTFFVIYEIRKLRRWRADDAAGLPSGPEVWAEQKAARKAGHAGA